VRQTDRAIITPRSEESEEPVDNLTTYLVVVVALVCTTAGRAHAAEPRGELDAWHAAALMGMGVNIGNTLESTSRWETGWGNPHITRGYIDHLATLGFRTVRLPVAWDTYAHDGRIQADKLARVGEVVDWITAAGMFCVVNIHWDGGWIDSSNQQRFADTYATFSPEAERKYRAYWSQIAGFFAGKNEKLVFEALNEETNFARMGSLEDAYATLRKVNQIFINTVRHSGGNNTKRLLIVTGYSTDIGKTTSGRYVLPTDPAPHRLFVSVHYYTPWIFAGMSDDAGWAKAQPTWGSPRDLAELSRLFDSMQEFCVRNDIPAFVGEFGVTPTKETASRVRWMSAVIDAALSRKMVPVLWETGGDISRSPPYAASPALRQVLRAFALAP
jgi:endoglucanase